MLGARTRSIENIPLLPITKDILHKLIDSIPFNVSSPYLRSMYKALFLLCYHACLRIGEAVHSTSQANTLQMNQISKSAQGYFITFISYKHSDPSTHPKFLLSPLSTFYYCPVQAMDRYIAVRGNTPGPLFIQQANLPVNRASFVHFLNKCLVTSNLQVSRYNTHSFRIGRATQMAMVAH